MSYEEVLNHHDPKQKYAMFRFMASCCQLQMQLILPHSPSLLLPGQGPSGAFHPCLAPTKLTGLTLTIFQYTTLKKDTIWMIIIIIYLKHDTYL